MFQDFYYLYSNEELTYSAMPTGEVDSDKIRQKDPKFWVSRNLQEETKPKTLILNDFFLRARSNEKQYALKEKLGELLSQKFPIFFWRKEKLVALDHNNLSELVNAQATYPKTIIKEAIKNHGLTKDSVFLLNDYWVNQLLSGKDELQEHALYASLWGQVDKDFKTEALKQLAHVKPNITQFIYDFFPENEAIKPPANMNLKVLRRYEEINEALPPKLSDDMLNDELRVVIKNTFDVYSEDILISLLRFADKIKSLELYTTSMTEAGLKQLLGSLPNVIHLDLSFSTPDTFSPLKLSCLSILKSLHLNHIAITPTQLEQLVLGASNLETLTLDYCNNLTAEPLALFQSGCLGKLKSLNLFFSSISTIQLEQLLLAAPNLETLYFCDQEVKPAEPLPLFQSVNLDKLKSLILESSSITTIQLEQLLLASPILKPLG